MPPALREELHYTKTLSRSEWDNFSNQKKKQVNYEAWRESKISEAGGPSYTYPQTYDKRGGESAYPVSSSKKSSSLSSTTKNSWVTTKDAKGIVYIKYPQPSHEVVWTGEYFNDPVNGSVVNGQGTLIFLENGNEVKRFIGEAKRGELGDGRYVWKKDVNSHFQAKKYQMPSNQVLNELRKHMSYELEKRNEINMSDECKYITLALTHFYDFLLKPLLTRTHRSFHPSCFCKQSL